jgi:hypothetical protein
MPSSILEAPLQAELSTDTSNGRGCRIVPALTPSGYSSYVQLLARQRLGAGRSVQRKYHGMHPVFLPSNTQVRLLDRWHGAIRQSTISDADSLFYEHRKTVRFLTDPHSLPQVQLLVALVDRNAFEYQF